MTRVMKIISKYDDGYFDASTDELWLSRSHQILKQRLEEGWYVNPEALTIWEAENRKAETALLEITEEQIANTPQAVRNELQYRINQAKNKAKRQQEDIEYYKEIIAEVEDGPTWTTIAKGTASEKKIPTAWLLLRSNSDGEYEQVELIEVK